MASAIVASAFAVAFVAASAVAFVVASVVAYASMECRVELHRMGLAYVELEC